MAYPFEPLSTEKLKEAFKIMVVRNCRIKETDQCRKKTVGDKLYCSARILKTWRQKERNL